VRWSSTGRGTGPIQHLLYKKRGIEAIDGLHTWQIRHLPVLVMMDAGVPLEKVREWSKRIDEDDRQRASERTARKAI